MRCNLRYTLPTSFGDMLTYEEQINKILFNLEQNKIDSVGVNALGDNKFSITFTFTGGREITTNEFEIVIPEGEEQT